MTAQFAECSLESCQYGGNGRRRVYLRLGRIFKCSATDHDAWHTEPLTWLRPPGDRCEIHECQRLHEAGQPDTTPIPARPGGGSGGESLEQSSLRARFEAQSAAG